MFKRSQVLRVSKLNEFDRENHEDQRLLEIRKINSRLAERWRMFQDLIKELLVLAVEDRPLGRVVHVQELEQNAEDDGD